MKISFLSILTILIISCSRNSDVKKVPFFQFKSDVKETSFLQFEPLDPKLEIIDSINVPIKVEGFNEYIPLAISDSKNHLIFITSRATKLIYIYDFNKKTISSINVESFLNQKLKYGIDCAGFLSNKHIALFVDEKFLVIDFIKNELIRKTDLPTGSYSSYNKKLVPFYSKNDTLIISEYSSSKQDNNDFVDIADAVIDNPVLSIYSVSKNRFEEIYLPELSRFSKENLGLGVSRFSLYEDKLQFVVSPENKIYELLMNQADFEIEQVSNFQYQTRDTVFGFPRDNSPKDIIKLTNINPHITSIVRFKNYTLISYMDGMTNWEYTKLHSKFISEKERMDLFVNSRRSHYMILDNDNSIQYRGEKLDKKIMSLSLKYNDSTFILMPNNAYYFKADTIPIFIATLKL